MEAFLLIVILVTVAIGVYSWSSRLRSRSSGGPAGRISGPGDYEVDVVGESHYQDALERICDGRTDESAEKYVDAALILEDDNRHDRKAVRVDIEGRTVGYLSREFARSYRDRLKQAGHPDLVGICKAVIVGGWDRGKRGRGHFGVRLDLPYED